MRLYDFRHWPDTVKVKCGRFPVFDFLSTISLHASKKIKRNFNKLGAVISFHLKHGMSIAPSLPGNINNYKQIKVELWDLMQIQIVPMKLL